jgi:ssDNA-binding Zn-finger/Zn-ribbon topoisomerase 1
MFNKNDEIEVVENLGRLKHTTKETCEDCGKAKMQLRVRTVENADVEYLYCPKCGFEKTNGRIKLVEIHKKNAKEILNFEDKIAKAQELKRKNRFRRK